MGLTLLFHSSTPTKIWDYAFETTVYLINWLPTKSLNFKSSHEILHGHKPDYSNLRVFGCLCYLYLRPYTRHKLEPRSQPCVFLEYPYHYQGYRCLNPATGCVFISTQVVFDESSLSYRTDMPISVEVERLFSGSASAPGTPGAPFKSIIIALQKEFAMKDLGPLHFFLGMEARRNSAGLYLTQSKYIHDILTRTSMLECKPISSPVNTGPRLSIRDGSSFEDPSLYRSVVGSLQYLSLTRPDIAYSVNQVCQFLHCPTTTHWQAVKRILRYLKGTITHELHIHPSSMSSVHGFSNADWVGNPDDRRSVSGFVIFLGSNPVSWSSKKQRTVARSSTESEYKSLANATAEILWLQSLLQELGISQHHPPTLWCDNISTIYLTANPIFHACNYFTFMYFLR
ncbi:hypothetical protein CRG98_008555 [Punica granatum]|uniref:Reverse transcriptase Ty1/copia-type domain-containing protein n=1 Tax=Punica granatum TaxID=22663 RepID=A0A2I0KR50_PUNGR|nr:hypothetical protein CRG98_008555 [Punica granatum]